MDSVPSLSEGQVPQMAIRRRRQCNKNAQKSVKCSNVNFRAAERIATRHALSR
jgi:hypothetical protein